MRRYLRRVPTLISTIVLLALAFFWARSYHTYDMRAENGVEASDPSTMFQVVLSSSRGHLDFKRYSRSLSDIQHRPTPLTIEDAPDTGLKHSVWWAHDAAAYYKNADYALFDNLYPVTRHWYGINWGAHDLPPWPVSNPDPDTWVLNKRTHEPEPVTTGYTIIRVRYLRLPYWLFVALFAIAPARWLLFSGWLSTRRRRRLGLCLYCGYDLRASGDTCPECGRPIQRGREPLANSKGAENKKGKQKGVITDLENKKGSSLI